MLLLCSAVVLNKEAQINHQPKSKDIHFKLNLMHFSSSVEKVLKRTEPEEGSRSIPEMTGMIGRCEWLAHTTTCLNWTWVKWPVTLKTIKGMVTSAKVIFLVSFFGITNQMFSCEPEPRLCYKEPLSVMHLDYSFSLLYDHNLCF